jgi:hypothetical protein
MKILSLLLALPMLSSCTISVEGERACRDIDFCRERDRDRERDLRDWERDRIRDLREREYEYFRRSQEFCMPAPQMPAPMPRPCPERGRPNMEFVLYKEEQRPGCN